MRFEFIEPFVACTMRVLDSVIESTVTKGDVALVTTREINGDVAIVIAISGESEGNIILNMGAETAVELASIMLGSQEREVSPLVLDTMSELANMIAGNATSALNDMGYRFDLFPPRVVDRREFEEEAEDVEVFQIPLFTEYGQITMNVALRTG